MDADEHPVTIAVVIPLYNKEKAVEATIGSLLGQSRLPDELILVDDGSTDRSLELAEKALARSDSAVRTQVIRQANAGVSVARNAGANAASAEYIAFLDADDEWLPGYLAEVEHLAKAFREASVLTIRHARPGADGEPVPVPTALPKGHFGIVERFLDTYRRGYGLIHTSATTVRRDAWDRSGGFPPGARKSQDMFLWLKLGLSETVAHSSAVLCIWHDEHSGVIRRKGAVPFHFAHFLGTPEGRQSLANRDLRGFLGSNLVVQAAGHRLAGDRQVVEALRGLASALPLGARLRFLAAAFMPEPVLRSFVWWRRRSRGHRK